MTKEKARQLRAEAQYRGTGERETYVPYIRVARGEFTSRGRSHIFPSAFFDRSHHVLSDIELHVLWLLQLMTPWDIREQFPLLWFGASDSFEALAPDASGTVELAKKLGIAHPAFSKHEPKRMTTDFVVQMRDGSWHAFHVKYLKDLADERKMELRRIEASYWSERSITLHVIVEEHIDLMVTTNLAMLLTFDKATLGVITNEWLHNTRLLASVYPMNQVVQELVGVHRYCPDHHANLVKFALATGQMTLDMSVQELRWSDVWPSISIRNVKA